MDISTNCYKTIKWGPDDRTPFIGAACNSFVLLNLLRRWQRSNITTIRCGRVKSILAHRVNNWAKPFPNLKRLEVLRSDYDEGVNKDQWHRFLREAELKGVKVVMCCRVEHDVWWKDWQGIPVTRKSLGGGKPLRKQQASRSMGP